MQTKHSHYFKDSPHEQLDVYRVLKMFNVTDPCIQHAIKKLLVAGGRGAGKDIDVDVCEAVDTLERWKEMQQEDLRIEFQTLRKERESNPLIEYPDL